MDYELAKQLKDAGWEKEALSIGDRYYDYDFNEAESPRVYWDADKESNFVYIPTLSELIEACGRKIVLEEGGEESIYWFRLCGWTSDEWMCGYLFPGIWLHKTLGKTPEEATTKLWLKLNKK